MKLNLGGMGAIEILGNLSGGTDVERLDQAKLSDDDDTEFYVNDTSA
jgi:hypothetical protein